MPPRLVIYLTKKKPKTRMIDVHKTGAFIPLKVDLELLLSKTEGPANFEASLKHIPDLIDYIG